MTPATGTRTAPVGAGQTLTDPVTGGVGDSARRPDGVLKVTGEFP